MSELFSGEVDESHYRPHDVIDLTWVNDVPAPVDAEGQPVDFDWEMPDGMTIIFPKQSKP